MTTMLDLDDALAHAVDVAQSAGDLLKEAHEKMKRDGIEALQIQTKKNASDFVTVVDASVQKHVIGRIREKYPEHRFVAEEDGADKLGDPESPYIWTVDPLDGTTNFIHQKRSFATMIALLKDQEIVAGVIYLPLLGDWFQGRKGGGAFYNGKPVELRQTKDMNDAILSTNITHRAKPCVNGERHVALPVCASVHNYGCAADEMGEILRGGNDGVFYKGVGLWDIAPGCLLIQEAGGKARWEFVDPTNPRKGVDCSAATKEIYGEVEKLIFD